MKSIIFDMDGTLIDSGNVIANAINHVRVNSGLDVMEKNYLLQNINNPHINTAQFFYGTDNFTNKHTQLFEDYYHKHCISDIRLYDGIEQLLEKLKDNFILTIATNASTVFALQMTEHLNIQHYFKDIIGADYSTPRCQDNFL
jgi:phosphoglycolate phosphatase